MAHSRFVQSSPENDINILLLGGTGVGKTTFINALFNYLSYNTLDDALNGELKVLIPSSFTKISPETFESTTVCFGTGIPDDNENPMTCVQSSTQLCRSYKFSIGNRIVRLIDGPGVGDGRGPNHDAIHFDHILSYISNYEHLNGICILLRSAETVLNIFFRHCFKQLLRHLHVNAKDNITFIFTNARETFYLPNMSARLLKVFLGELYEKTGVEVPLNRYNTFMFDNESFRYLAACKQGLIFLNEEKANYSVSWNKSVDGFSRLVIRILQCDRLAVQNMKSFSEAKLLIQKLSRPMAEIVTLIQNNILMAQQYKEKLLNNSIDLDSNKLPQKTGKIVPLQERLTVCMNDKCTEIIDVNGEQRVNYNCTCDAGCSFHRVVQECIGHLILKQCQALRETCSCRECGCSWTFHMHITYRYDRNLTYVGIDDPNKTRTPQSIMLIIDKRISDLRSEESQIRTICAKLSQFLKRYSIIPFHDDFIKYLEHFMNEEKRKTLADNVDIIQGLEKMIKDYKDEVDLFNRNAFEADYIAPQEIFVNPVEIEEIFTLIEKLYNLPINGKLIEEQIRWLAESQAQAVGENEHTVDLPSDFNCPDILKSLKEIVNH